MFYLEHPIVDKLWSCKSSDTIRGFHKTHWYLFLNWWLIGWLPMINHQPTRPSTLHLSQCWRRRTGECTQHECGVLGRLREDHRASCPPPRRRAPRTTRPAVRRRARLQKTAEGFQKTKKAPPRLRQRPPSLAAAPARARGRGAPRGVRKATRVPAAAWWLGSLACLKCMAAVIEDRQDHSLT